MRCRQDCGGKRCPGCEAKLMEMWRTWDSKLTSSCSYRNPLIFPFVLKTYIQYTVINTVPYRLVPAVPYLTGQKTVHINIQNCTGQIPVCMAKYRTVPVFSVKYRPIYTNLNKISNFCTLIFLFFLKFKMVRTRYTDT